MLQPKSTQSKMGSIETEHNPQSQTSLFFLDDCLYCEEKCVEDHDEDLGVSSLSSDFDVLSSEFDVSPPEEDEDQLLTLFSKEGKIAHLIEGEVEGGESFMDTRRETLDWMKMVSAHHDFSANTLVLGVNYFDRFMLSFGSRTRSDLPWMTQVAAIACLSLASKIQETRSRSPQPSLLSDFQIDCKYIFEAKTIQRMELLVLSTLEWKMNVVTPLSFFGHLIKRLKLKTHLHREILCRFEPLVLSAILDVRSLCYFPSVLAAAALVQALKELGLWGPLEHQIQLMNLFKATQDKVEECHKFIQELPSNNNSTLKRKYVISAKSSNDLDILLSESSKESSISSLMSSPEPLHKKR